MTIEIRRAESRFRTSEDGRETFHSFAFGAHYDPRNTGFSAITAFNDENLHPGTGYAEHPHRDVEIVTWVLDGVLLHTDPVLGSRELGPGEVLCTSAGTGIVHSERATPGAPTRFVQTWLRPDAPGGEPSMSFAAPARAGGLVEVIGTGSTPIGVRDARLYLGQPEPGRLALPDAPRMMLFIAEGGIELGDRALAAGDCARLSDEGARSILVPESATIALWAFRS